MSDIEHLITAVESHPCIWNNNHEDYYNRDVKEQAWDAIAKEIYSSWESFEGIKKLSTCNDLKKKWTYIRDYYRKDLQRAKSTKSGSTTKHEKRPYLYAPFLEFLRPTFEKSKEVSDPLSQFEIKSEGNTNDAYSLIQNDEESEESVNEEINQDKEPTLPTSSTKSPVKSINSQRAKYPTHFKTVSKQNVAQKILNYMEGRGSQRLAMEDDDQKFLLSFRGDMKRMNSRQKLDFKIGVLKLVKQLLYHSESPHSSNACSD